MADILFRKVLGCIIGASIGDAIGAVVEFNNRETMRRNLGGKEWVDDMYPFNKIEPGPFGVFRENPPRGTGTDDTRLNQIFLECVIRNKGFINSQLLAMEYIERYRDAEKHYPKTVELARRHMSAFYPMCCTHLGMKDLGKFNGERYYVLDELNSFPILVGLLTLQSTGLLYQDEPEKSYLKAVELDFFDIGYAKDATGLLAAMVSSALRDRQRTAKEIIDAGIKTNPFQIGGLDGTQRIMTGIDPLLKHGPSLPRFFEAVDKAKTEQEAIIALARECEYLHPFSPLDVLGVPMAIIRFTGGDPVQSVLMAANHRRVDAEGRLIALRDVDCVAMVTGVLVGAMNGVDAFPKKWVKDVISANEEVYGFNIEENAKNFYRTVYG